MSPASTDNSPATGLERERIVKDVSRQGVVYAIALLVVLVMFLLAEFGPITRGGPVETAPATRSSTLFPQSTGQ
ncbi:MAG: hypothetical protein HN404_00360 [Gemmatimonadetes bacterium]|nr:hypothetical protein [Gemmatimonadota bacterium]